LLTCFALLEQKAKSLNTKKLGRKYKKVLTVFHFTKTFNPAGVQLFYNSDQSWVHEEPMMIAQRKISLSP
jgi:hypothetical protein